MSADDPVVHVPADIEVEDRLVGPVTARMSGWLAVASAGAVLATVRWPEPVAVAAGALLATVGALGALWRPGGRPVTGWLAPLLAYRGRRRSTSARGRVAARAPGAVRRPLAPALLVTAVLAGTGGALLARTGMSRPGPARPAVAPAHGSPDPFGLGAWDSPGSGAFVFVVPGSPVPSGAHR